jgi:hypothetical protein
MAGQEARLRLRSALTAPLCRTNANHNYNALSEFP